MSKMFQVYGIGQALIPVLPPPLHFQNAPTSTQTNYEIGQVVYTGNPGTYTFYIYAGAGVWEVLDSSSGNLDTLTTDDSTVVVPTAGNINLKGTGSTTTVGSGSNATVELTGLTNHSVLVGAGTATITKLAVGTTGQVLTGASAADPAFAALGTNSGLTAHGVLMGENNSAIVASSAGTAGQVFTSGGASADGAYAALGTNSGLTVHGVLLGENNSAIAATAAGTNGQVLLGSTSADPAFGTLTTSTGVGFTTGAAALAVNLIQGGYKINAASTGVALVAQNSYTVSQAGQTSFSLPATAAIGDMFLIAGTSGNTGGLEITQGTGQTIRQNTNATTTTTGNVASGAANTSMWVMCVVANTDFIILASVGTLTFT
jgi:hypothetical protein